MPPSWLSSVLRWNPVAIALCRRGVRQHVAGELLGRELIEGHVEIERLDHPVAVLPHRAQRVLLVPVRVCVPRQVEPWTRPTLAVMGRCEEAIDDSLVRVRCAVGHERVELLWCRRQTDEVQGHAAQQPLLRRFRGWRQAFGFQRRQDEAVDGRAGPALVANGWRRVPHRPDVGPVLRRLGRQGCRGLAAGVGPGGALLDPPPDEGYLRIGQRVLVERHPVLAVEAQQTPHEDAVLAVARRNRGTAHAAGQHVRLPIEPQLAARLFRPVALVAVRVQNRLDIAHELDR